MRRTEGSVPASFCQALLNISGLSKPWPTCNVNNNVYINRSEYKSIKCLCDYFNDFTNDISSIQARSGQNEWVPWDSCKNQISLGVRLEPCNSFASLQKPCPSMKEVKNTFTKGSIRSEKWVTAFSIWNHISYHRQLITYVPLCKGAFSFMLVSQKTFRKATCSRGTKSLFPNDSRTANATPSSDFFWQARWRAQTCIWFGGNRIILFRKMEAEASTVGSCLGRQECSTGTGKLRNLELCLHMDYKTAAL